MPCCGGSGFADHATAPCMAEGCTAAASRWFTATQALEAGSSALAAHDDMVGYGGHTPVFEAVAEQLGGDPRGLSVQTWEEIRYASGRRRLRDGGDDGAGGGLAGTG